MRRRGVAKFITLPYLTVSTLLDETKTTQTTHFEVSCHSISSEALKLQDWTMADCKSEL